MTMVICQDRLGTNIVKALQKRCRFLEAYSTETNRGHDTYNISTFDLHDTYLPQYLLRSMLVWCKNG